MGIFSKKTAQAPERPVPQHIAIIMDGNGRWATRRGKPRYAGHAVGSETLRTIADYCRSIGVRYLTVYAFSTENWKRSEEEIGTIMGLLDNYLHEALRDMEKNKTRIVFYGNLDRLSPELRELCIETQERSKDYQDVQVNICLNYGGRDEIVMAARRFARDCAEGKARAEDLDEARFSEYLYSAGVPDPELIIRPSGEKRTSNFLLWQSAYSEYVFMDVLWPDFTTQDLEQAIAEFNQRSRRFGGVK